MTLEEMKGDINFRPWNEVPAEVYTHMLNHQSTRTQYISYIHVIGIDDLPVIRTWAYKMKGNKLLHTEVERKAPGFNGWAVRKNIYFTTMGGYHPVYEPKTFATGNWYGYTSYYFSSDDFNVWYTDKIMGLFSPIINTEKLFEIEKYKYCGYSYGDIIKYLELYEKYPEVEYFGKLEIMPSVSLIRKAKKDKQFIKFLVENKDKVRGYGPKISIYAYEHHMSFENAESYLSLKKHAEDYTKFDGIKEFEIDRIKLYQWIKENNISCMLYRDYWNACIYLGLDMTDTKNLKPREFMRMHDMRIDQAAAEKVKEDKRKKRKLHEDFRKAAEQLKKFEVDGEKYSVLIPDEVGDLVKEGNKLHHCVGKMGYDKKMADGKSFIAFIRLTESKDTPYVTVEYLLKENKIAQCYADHDSRPSEEVIDFVNKWGEEVKRGLKDGRKDKECVS